MMQITGVGTKRSFGDFLISAAAAILLIALPGLATAGAQSGSGQPPVERVAERDAELQPPGSTALTSGLFMADRTSAEQSDIPRHYSIEVRLPYLEGTPVATVAGFNQGIEDLVELDLYTFRANVADLRMPPHPERLGSILSVGYSVSTANSRLVSLFVDVFGYIELAAHPYHYTRGFTYDLAEARQLDLADLFIPGSDYLVRVADYSVAQLAPRLGEGFFSIGAEPEADNYLNWNLKLDSLVIEFNEYQVAPYALGPQSVEIPFAALEGILRADDRLASVRGR